jgi:thioesterase domain-containing protein/acyl carrier protein
MVPGTFVQLDRLPLNSSGKVDRKRLPQPSKTALPEDRPADLTEHALKDLWEELLGIHPIGLEDNFFDLGGHSLLAVKLFSRIDKVFGVRLPDSTLFQAPTIASLAPILRTQADRFNCLVPMQPLGDRPPFFCLHEIGGSVLGLRELARALGPEQPVYGVQAVGLDGSQRPYIRVEEMASHYIREIRALQPEGPYYLGGYCFGGVVAFEMARQLTADGQQVGLLAIVDTVLRHWLNLSFAENTAFLSTLAKRAGVHFHVWRKVPVRDKIRYVPARAYHYALSRIYHRRLGPLLLDALYKNRFEPALPILDWIFSLTRANKIAARRYRPLPSPIEVTLFKTGGHQTSLIDPTLGWAGIARQGVHTEELPGQHVTLIAQPHVKTLAARLKYCLQVAQAKSKPVERDHK